ncbi:oligoketide cyclase/lipid transport protein [Perkinsela sp. CCAP 1560/4]|nr:oligoketide cyclase/lipid transport protein [Perkinsela sp. CCAP 1560/4]|eukprot:KNH09352.1 oligoketide cyclase/lipid transport protein [Perkinsela sp. CCAP 1560/4]
MIQKTRARHVLSRLLAPSPLHHHHANQCILGHSVDEIHSVVSDVEKYSEFLPWCEQSTVHIRRKEYMEATLNVRFLCFRESYRSKVVISNKDRIDTELIGENSFLKSLHCSWEFQNISQDEMSQILDKRRPRSKFSSRAPERKSYAKIWFKVDFVFANATHSKLCGIFMNHVVHKMTKGFERRCREKYGPPSFVHLKL